MRRSSLLVLGVSLAVSTTFSRSPAFGRPRPSSTTKVARDPMTREQLRILAEQSKSTLACIGALMDQFKQSISITLPASAQVALNSVSSHLVKAEGAAEDALNSGLDEEKLRYKMSVLTSEVEMIRSGLTRLKLGLSNIDLDSSSQAILRDLEVKIDNLRDTFQPLRPSE